MNTLPRPNDEMPPEPLKPLDPLEREQREAKSRSDVVWPFPTKSNPAKPWTDKQVKQYNKVMNEKLGDSPL